MMLHILIQVKGIQKIKMNKITSTNWGHWCFRYILFPISHKYNFKITLLTKISLHKIMKSYFKESKDSGLEQFFRRLSRKKSLDKFIIEKLTTKTSISTKTTSKKEKQIKTLSDKNKQIHCWKTCPMRNTKGSPLGCNKTKR